MPLTDTAVKQAKPKDKPYRLSDEKGMYLEIRLYPINGGRHSLNPVNHTVPPTMALPN
ncbi:MAG: hypothetical protein ACJAW0_000331 [Zhongshania sp.]|jgi:hypothetical protein